MSVHQLIELLQTCMGKDGSETHPRVMVSLVNNMCPLERKQKGGIASPRSPGSVGFSRTNVGSLMYLHRCFAKDSG